MKIWRVALSAVAVLTLVATTGAQSAFTLKVHTGRGQVGYDVNSTMTIGERDLVVIDPQFSLSEAHKLAAESLETRKRLTTIYSTHAHPNLYNIFHSNTPTTYEAVYDPPPRVRRMRPTAVLQPRFVRFNVQFDF